MTVNTSEIDIANLKILLVDDDEFALGEMCDAVDLEGWQAITANSVESAIDILDADQDIRIVITDVHFIDPDGRPANGIQFVSRAQARFSDRNLSYLVLSGDPAAVKSAFQVGAFTFLSKPIDTEELAKAVRTAVASGGGERENLADFQGLMDSIKGKQGDQTSNQEVL